MFDSSMLAAVTSTHMDNAERLGAVPLDRLTPEQREALETFRRLRRMDVFGPFVPLLWSPEVMTRTAALGEYLRDRSVFPPRLSEFMILIAARHWMQQYEWSLHYPIALKAGVAKDVADDIGDGRRPARMSDEEEMLYDFTTELIHTKHVSDPAYARVLVKFGEKGVIDAISITGYYSLLAMVLNTARTPPEPGGPLLPPRR